MRPAAQGGRSTDANNPPRSPLGTGGKVARGRGEGRAASWPASLYGSDADYNLEEGDGETNHGPYRSEAGVVASTRAGLGLPPVWRAVDLISTTVAKIPLAVYRRVDPARPEMGKLRSYDHPAAPLLGRKASPELLSYHLKKTLTAHALYTGKGNGYAYIKRAGDGTPLEIWILNPNATFPVRVNGTLWYVTEVNQQLDPKTGQPVSGEPRKLFPSDVIHIKGLGFDGLVGYDIVSYMRETLGLSIGLRKFGARFFKNFAVPGTILERPMDAPRLSRQGERNLTKSFDAIHQGLDRSHRTAVLQEGTKANVLGVDARSAQLIQEREFQIREVSAFTGVPPHKLGDTTRTAYASLEQENQAFLDDCIDGWLCQWEAECTDKLMSEDEKAAGSAFVEFVREAFLRTSLETQTNALVSEVNNGGLNVDEWRAIRNRPPLPDGLGQAYRMPANLVLLGQNQVGGGGETVEGGGESVGGGGWPGESERAAISPAVRGLVGDAVRRMVRRLERQQERVAADPAARAGWLAGLEQRNAAVLAEAFGPVCAVLNERGVGTQPAEAGRRLCAAIRELNETKPADDPGLVARIAEALCA